MYVCMCSMDQFLYVYINGIQTTLATLTPCPPGQYRWVGQIVTSIIASRMFLLLCFWIIHPSIYPCGRNLSEHFFTSESFSSPASTIQAVPPCRLCPMGTFKPVAGDSIESCQPCPSKYSSSSEDRVMCSCSVSLVADIYKQVREAVTGCIHWLLSVDDILTVIGLGQGGVFWYPHEQLQGGYSGSSTNSGGRYLE